MTHLLVAAILIVGFALFSRTTAVEALDNRVSTTLFASAINALVLAVVFLFAYGLVVVLD